MPILKAMDISIKRNGPSEVIRGHVVKGEIEYFTIKGNLQPERNIKLLREVYGERVEGAIKVYTKEKLLTSNNQYEADIIDYDGNEYEVTEVRKYDTVIPHFKIIAIRIKDEFNN